MKHQFLVKDMTCGYCVKTITEAVHADYPQAVVEADSATHWLTITSDADAQALMMTIQAAGYTPELT